MLRLGFADRIASALLGVVFGAIYGAILAIVVGFFTDGQFHVQLVWTTATVFPSLGFLFGPVVGDFIGGFIHLILDFFSGLLSGSSLSAVDPEPSETGWLRGLFVVGLGTGIAVYIFWRQL
jgi:hypothetical protein